MVCTNRKKSYLNDFAPPLSAFTPHDRYRAERLPAPVREGWQAVKGSSLDDMRTQNIRFWQQAGGAAIRKSAWELVVETWHAQHRAPNELRVQRLAPTVRET